MNARQPIPSFIRFDVWHRVLLILAVLVATSSVAVAQMVSSPRLRTSELPVPSPEAFGGGEVLLELAVDASGAVTQVSPLRVTPPFSDTMMKMATSWRFQPAVVVINKRETPAPGKVLVAGLFRPPTLYAGPAPGAPPEARDTPSPDVPRPNQLVMPAYPPNVTGDRMVLIEIELTPRAEPLGYRVVSPASGFDGAALDAVKAWRFNPPTAAAIPDRLFVYAVLAFRTPVTGAAR
jgi:outer membrane biosynthesis protein TonB